MGGFFIPVLNQDFQKTYKITKIFGQCLKMKQCPKSCQSC